MRRFVCGRTAVAAPAAAFLALATAALVAAALPPGPPFPPPDEGRAVYDVAGVFRPDTIARAEATIDAIEERTGAEVVVYAQNLGYSATTEEAERHAIALMDQWGIGRRGFDDGLVILFDLDGTLRHGQVQLYAGPGYRAAFLTNAERQALFEEEMLPFLRAGDLDGALLVALARIDANATAEHAARLQGARQLDAVVGLVGAPTIFLLLAGWALVSWARYGRDPDYIDDPSVHMAGPPAGLTAATAAVVLDGRTSRRALTTAMLDLASRGLIAFREEAGILGFGRKVGVQLDPPTLDPIVAARQAVNGRRPVGAAERHALAGLQRLAAADAGGFIEPDKLLEFGADVADFDRRLEDHVVQARWFAERPSKVVTRWAGRGLLAFVAAAVLVVVGLNLPSQGLVLLGIAAGLAAVVMWVLARSMPAVTVPGALIRAMLVAYRRSLVKTMEHARSMNQVVAEAGLGWLETPDQAVVWGTALGIQEDVERVLARSLEDAREGRAEPSAYVPSWYSSAGSGSSSASPGRSGLFSSSSVPNLGGMMAVLGTIGNSPSSSGSDGGGGGGFGGGSSGGGGGGAGGGF